MHRSGTSLIARLLNLCGMDLGPATRFLPPAEDNPAGFWEHAELHEINEQILRRLGGSWDNPPPLPPGWERAPVLRPLYERARAIIDRDFCGVHRWGWKDPRNAPLAPFWKEVVPNLTFVICVRHPLDVSRSLGRREWFPTAEGIHLWTRYMLATLRHTSDSPRIITHYESYFDDWYAELSRLADFLGLSTSWSEQTKREIESFIAPHLWHHRSSLPDLLQSPEADPFSKELYTALHEVGTTVAADSSRLAPLDALAARGEQFLARGDNWRWLLPRCYRAARRRMGRTARALAPWLRSTFHARHASNAR